MPNKTIKFHSAFHSMVRDGRKTLTQRVVKDVDGNVIDSASIEWPSFGWEHFEEDGTLMGRTEIDTRHMVHGKNGEPEVAGGQELEVVVFPVKCPFTVGELLTVDGTTMQVRVASIDCQRLQDTTEEQAKREGFERTDFHSDTHAYIDRPMAVFQAWRWVGDGHLDAIANMWRDIYPSGPKSWESNPVTWPVGFEYAGEVEDE